MKSGDLIRWRKMASSAHGGNPPWKLGILVEYQSWEKIATVLSEGALHRISARDVEIMTQWTPYKKGGLNESR